MIICIFLGHFAIAFLSIAYKSDELTIMVMFIDLRLFEDLHASIDMILALDEHFTDPIFDVFVNLIIVSIGVLFLETLLTIP